MLYILIKEYVVQCLSDQELQNHYDLAMSKDKIEPPEFTTTGLSHFSQSFIKSQQALINWKAGL